MTFKVEYSDQRFRVVAPDGDFEEAVGYCSVSSIEYQGKVYGIFLSGDEPDLETLSSDPDKTVMQPATLRVQELSGWPKLSPVDTVIEEIDFEEDDDEGDDAAEGADVIDMEPAQ